ncbi:Zinc-regulated transporter 1 [Wickerhamiella sorbophila]|uniref:Zinc-regulated transporter 1 n=1 Tax=Wickerhamiella sorbophila TaxID=45607 RepID=A0A2T0FCD3_9ASCO|nr:Zinc-regulated transporter 1 [Wickerhamiella sorbophila]PRT52627.1 Zinc-regulated transporter 1 [Wickerhamiella sorbophila]
MFVKLIYLAVIFITSLAACIYPVVSSFSSRSLYVLRHFGTGVIISTAILHLLEPANDALTEEILPEGWQNYPWAFALCLVGLFLTVLGDIFSQRHLYKKGISHSHGQALTIETPSKLDSEIVPDISIATQISGLLVLEIGIVLHSLFIGLSLGATEKGGALALAIVFHQTFEGLGLGARLSSIEWPQSKAWVPKLLAILYAVTTPVGILIGIALSEQYDEDSPTALIVTGICDSLSSGILLYTGLVELLGNELVNAHDLPTAPLKDVLVAYGSITAGCYAMACLAIWI